MSDYGTPDTASQRRRRSERYQQPSQMASNTPYVQPAASQQPASVSQGRQSVRTQSSQQRNASPYGQHTQPQGYQPFAQQPSGHTQPGFPQMAPGGYPPSGVVPPQIQGNWRQFSYDAPPQQPWTAPYPSSGDTLPVPRSPVASQSTQRQGSPGGPPPRKRWPILLLVLIALVVIVVASIQIGNQTRENQQLHTYVTAYDDRFCEGVYVDGIHLGGMTQEEGFAAVTQKAQQRNDSWYVTLTHNNQAVTTIRAAHLGMSVDVTDVLMTAWEQGHTGSIQQRKQTMEALAHTPWNGYTALPSGNTAVIDSTLAELSARANYSPVNAAITGFDPTNVTEPFTFQKEVNGQYVDTEALKTRIYQMVSTLESGSLPIPLVSIPATVTEAQLRQKVSQRSSFYTKISTSSTENRNNNIIRSFELISGTVLKPGETFSFNNTVGKRTLERGFYPAIEYANREEVEGIGGGVCQASTTLYIAAVQAGLEIVKREPHSDKVNYTDYGKDATVYWESKKIDFSFKNNTSSDIYIVCGVKPNPENKYRKVAWVSIYGEALDEGVSYDIVTEQIETLPIPLDPVRKKDKNAKYVTYTDEEHLISGEVGCVIQSYRVKYVNGVETERIPLYKDRYEPKSDVIYVGVTKRP